MSTTKSRTKPPEEAYTVEVTPKKVNKMSKDAAELGQDLYEQFAKEAPSKSLTVEQSQAKIRTALEATAQTKTEIAKALRRK